MTCQGQKHLLQHRVKFRRPCTCSFRLRKTDRNISVKKKYVVSYKGQNLVFKFIFPFKIHTIHFDYIVYFFSLPSPPKSFPLPTHQVTGPLSPSCFSKITTNKIDKPKIQNKINLIKKMTKRRSLLSIAQLLLVMVPALE